MRTTLRQADPERLATLRASSDPALATIAQIYAILSSTPGFSLRLVELWEFVEPPPGADLSERLRLVMLEGERRVAGGTVTFRLPFDVAPSFGASVLGASLGPAAPFIRFRK